MREFINGRFFNLAMLILSAVVFIVSAIGAVPFMSVLFGLYVIVFGLHLLFPFRAIAPAVAIDAEYV